ncbi:hypothetical protein CLV56_2651 [Mumia flava]|uniref:Cadherin domain-containing protein n=1 Tax=Mumia flava TaxID=1348852 RepID=A0A2M9BKF3_9ACTN|nr:Ig-like domain-containing protein [Mumia flava]PJJ58400.1 hypothetical protein CLV56_2651 [Mumia flava]
MSEPLVRARLRRPLAAFASGALVAGTALTATALGAGTAYAADLDENFNYDCNVVAAGLPLGIHDVGVRAQVTVPDEVSPGEAIPPRETQITLTMPETLRNATYVLLSARQAGGYSDDASISITAEGYPDTLTYPIENLSAPFSPVPPNVGDLWQIPTVGDVPQIDVPTDVTVPGSTTIHMPAAFNVTASLLNANGDLIGGEGAVTMACTITSESDVFGTIPVVPGNSDPTAGAVTASTDEDTPVDITLDGADADGDPLTYSYTQPANGEVTGTGPDVTYTPAAGFDGEDSFEYTVDDGNGGTATNTVTVTVSNVNKVPVANDVAVSTDENTAVDVAFDASDPDGDDLSYSYTQPANGEVTGNGANVTYTPAAGFDGEDSFEYTADDGNGGTATATVTVTVSNVNVPPTAGDVSASTDENTPVDITLDGADADGDALTYSYTQPANGEVSGDGPNVTYTPANGFDGDDSFEYTVDDGNGGTATGTVSVSVSNVNVAPTAGDVAAETDENTAVDITLDGADADGDDLTYSYTQPANGEVTGDGQDVTYTPAAGFDGTDTFSYTVSDGEAEATATVTVTVNNVNVAPTADDLSVTTAENTAVDITLAGSDADGDDLTYSYTQPLNGEVTGDGPNVTYTPAAGFDGQDGFTYTVDDGNGGTATGTVEITVSNVNVAPTAGDVAAETDENTAVDIALDGADADGDDLTYTYTQPTNGEVTGSGANVTYTPDAGFDGEDTFSYTVSDGLAQATATVTVTVNNVNVAPTADDVSVTLAEDTSVEITLAGDDADGDDLTYTYTDPSNGTLSGDAPALTYTPDPDYNGPDSFEYTVSDGEAEATATVSITVTPVSDNTAPTAGDVTASTDEDTAVDITLDGADADGDDLTYTYTQPANGTVSGTGPNVTYTPDAGFDGEDTFSYTVSDGLAQDTGSVTVTVSNVNKAPTADDLSVTLAEDTSVEIALAGADADGDALTYSYTQPANGEVTGDGATVTYTPAADFNGEDSFEYTVSDGQAEATATVSITVTPVSDNTAPTAGDVAASTDEDTAVDITLDGADADGDDLTYTYSQPSNGSVTGEGPDVTYTPAADFNGEDSFSYTVSDGQEEASATVTITVAPVDDNTAPTAGDVAAETDEDTAVDIALDGADADGDDLTYTYSQPSNGSVSGEGATVTYTPAAGFTGEDTFTYTVDDGNGGTASATVTVTVNGVNAAPTADDVSVTVAEDSSVDIVLAGADADGDDLTYTYTQPSNGEVTGDGPNVTYTPAADFNGEDSFEYTVSDGQAEATATVSITVTDVADNTAPTAGDVAASTDEDVAVDITLDGADADGDDLTYTYTQPSNGTVSGEGPNVTYTPAADFNGEDTFTYTVSDGLEQATATVTVTVAPVDDNTAPTAGDVAAETDENTPVDITLDGADADGDDLTYTYTQPSNGTVSGEGADVTYTPADGFDGTDSFTYTVDDGNGGTASATVTVTVNDTIVENTPPTAGAVSATTTKDTAVGITLNGADADGDDLTYTYTQPANGAVSGEGPNVTFTPASGFTGTTTFTYTVSDGEDEATATVTVTVNDTKPDKCGPRPGHGATLWELIKWLACKLLGHPIGR